MLSLEMMRNHTRKYVYSVAVVAAFSLLTGCGLLRKKAPVKELNGIWIPVQQEIGGSPIPVGFMEGTELTIADSRYKVIAGVVDKGVIRYNGDKMDIYGKKGPNAGKHFMAIYKYDNGELTICYNLNGDAYPKAFDTKSNAMFLLSVYKKKGKE
ncbi:hypothetical protein CJD36_021750 [Flavipsychrobacter stenotrophus]|uniref:TIGR03067 domain-containing protein n=1 Tax=Flavipsychrobacter stenotrophus TaxID=2077091 RepID=A0A2S7SQM1_9BACT|nr:hypothetical protein [Flavipsychrobacter stenotrophus]PQJ08895.1 hypothetical protein CJD36_021750 [Flavipsychrobacter stenotrophus]